MPSTIHSVAHTERFDAILFDLDGTLIDSTEAVVRHWTAIGGDLGIDPKTILATSHGRRSIDILKEIDPANANMEYVLHVEGLLPKRYGDGAKILPGVQDIIKSLVSSGAKWGIVTSGTSALADGWLERFDISRPDVFITADQVKNGKPDPEGYLAGREALGVDGESKRVLVVEDAPAGIRAGNKAGCQVLGLLTSHDKKEVMEAAPTWVVEDLSKVKVSSSGPDGIELLIEERR